MSFEKNIIDIKQLYYILTGKESCDVHCQYKGTSGGVVNPWAIRIDTKEYLSTNHEDAAEGLLKLLKLDLSKKISNLEDEADKFKKALHTFNN